MPFFRKSDTSSEDPELEASMIREAGEEQKNIDYSMQALADAEETHDKSTKASVNSQRAVDKAAVTESDSADALNRASRDHDTAVSNEQSAEKTAKTNQEYEARLGLNLAQKVRHLDGLQQRKVENDQLRESTLAQIHAQAAVTAAAADVLRTHADHEGHHTPVGGEARPRAGADGASDEVGIAA